ncbi:cation diffusion facilitator family transporter [Actinoplanes sp. SE50]|uniref:cation diffusion facilitator family transporter n=1 Tax=unclassified Actinoplanes TaxID=2626549 RepID=UPI00023EC069|nr:MULTISPECIES: cation diffusion facilitator family transporter [unclassified Actinoplanes]AEV82955.1 Zinc transporter 8 [Actinoplanes sp. SE50/110]ATO81351.1 cation diffusion facilitator family transporter [Actinoplanes sp. SE50]SLL98758.1 cation diffusion facilitator transporter [Actinoplanes sp. SE50/110]
MDHAHEHEHEHHDHGHDHDHGGHSHGVAADADRRWLSLALGLIGAFMIGEVVAGLIAHSLALLSDAAHMLTDAGAIVLALVAMRLAARPPRGGYTFGLKRAEILSAQANGLTMLILAVWLGVESIRRLIEAPPVAGRLVLITALVGIVVNLGAAWAMSRANRSSLNVEGAFQHVLNDLFAFIATAIAGVIMVTTGFTRADPIATLIVVVLMVKAGVGLIRESGRIFLEAAPTGIDPPALGARLAGVPGVVELHDLHVWQITSGQPALSAHVLVAEGLDCHAVRSDIESLLRRDYKITHSTLQVDHADTDPTRSTGYEVDLADPGGHCVDSHGESYRV